jgi:ribosome-associated protein
MSELVWDLAGREYVALCDLLKLTDLCQSGGEAKHVIAQGFVEVDGQVELRKRCKIRPAQVVKYKGATVRVL